MQSLDTYPQASWRPNQRSFCEKVLAAATQPDNLRIGLEGPCGCGKSIGYLRAAMAQECPPSIVLSTTRQHLAQIEDTLRAHWPNGSWAVLRGRSHYGCCDAPSKSKAVDAKDPDAADEWAHTACPLGEDCRYRAAVLAAGKAKVVVQCTIGHLYRARYWQREPDLTKAQSPAEIALKLARAAILNRDVVIVDEAHEYVGVRREVDTTRLVLYAAWITPSVRAALERLRMAPGSTYRQGYALLSSPRRQSALAALRAGLTEQRAAVAKQLDRAASPEKIERVLAKLDARLALLSPEPGTALSVTFGGPKGDWLELVSEPAVSPTNEPLARVEIFTSATLRPVAKLLHIPAANVTAFPEIFDWAGKVKVIPLADPNPGSKKNEPLDAALLAGLLSQPGRPTTIVLAFSRAHAQSVARDLGRDGVFVQGEGEDAEASLAAVVQAAKARPGSILVTYGGWVGTDIPGNKWLVLASVPKSPIGPAAETRAIMARQSAWDDYERAALDRLKLAQGLGRALRTPEDQAVVIFQNNAAARELGLCPKTARMIA